MKNIQAMNVQITEPETDIKKPQKNNALSQYKESLPIKLRSIPHMQLPLDYQAQHIKAVCYFFEELYPNLSDRLFKATTMIGCILTEQNFKPLTLSTVFSSCFSNIKSHAVEFNINFNFQEKMGYEAQSEVEIGVEEGVEEMDEAVSQRFKKSNIWDSQVGSISVANQIFKLLPHIDEKEKMLFIVSVLIHIQNAIDLNAVDCDLQMSGFTNGEYYEDSERIKTAIMDISFKIVADKNTDNMQTTQYLQ